VLLGYSPRFQIVHTSSEEIGQIYVPNINWALFLLTCWLVLEFRSSSALASAYGIAVSLTMIITTLLACSVAHRSWHWSSARTLVVLTVFFIIDITFFGANLIKLFDGGWVPLTVGAVVFTIMTTWRRGRQILMKRMRERLVPMVKFKEMLKAEPPARVRGTAVFMTGDPDGTPPALLHNFRHNRILHKKNILLTILTEEVPHVDRINRVQLSTMDGDFYRVTAHYGFMETPDVKDIFAACSECGVVIDLQDSTFFLGRETLLPSNRPGMAIWREHLFAFMSRNAERATAFYGIPPEQVVEMGIQVEI
jgi:KUP system potassium uptake protein